MGKGKDGRAGKERWKRKPRPQKRLFNHYNDGEESALPTDICDDDEGNLGLKYYFEYANMSWLYNGN